MKIMQKKYSHLHMQMLTADDKSISFYRKLGFRRAEKWNRCGSTTAMTINLNLSIPFMNVSASIEIAAPIDRVWAALTNPEIIKLYLFGTKVISDWKVGDSIKFQGNWHGTPFEDRELFLSQRRILV